MIIIYAFLLYRIIKICLMIKGKMIVLKKKDELFAVCVNVKYLSENIGIFLNISLKGQEVYSEEVSGMLLITIL